MPLFDVIACIHCGLEVDVKEHIGLEIGKLIDKTVDDDTANRLHELELWITDNAKF